MSLAATMIILSFQIITTFLFITATVSSPHGFTIDLIPRRSTSPSPRLSNTQLGSSPYADTVFDTYEYLMKLQIGTPPFDIEAMIDTGSELVWTQCLPCHNCYNQPGPIFDPSKSSTFKTKQCDGPDHTCPYEIIYADQSYTKGIYATETVTIKSSSGQDFVMPNTTIGCGHNNSGIGTTTAGLGSGVVGLSMGSLSLISQMGENFLGLISYCFSHKGSGKINFGGNTIVTGDGTVAATMFIKTEQPSFYYLNLNAVSVGETRIETLGTLFHAEDGNILLDSGTTYTYLPGSYCNQVQEAVTNAVAADQISKFSNMLCYNSENIEIFPVITIHFSGGVDLVLDKYNMYIDMGGVFCLAILCAGDDGTAIFGNRAQNNFLVGYDPSSLLVSFRPTDCSAL